MQNIKYKDHCFPPQHLLLDFCPFLSFIKTFFSVSGLCCIFWANDSLEGIYFSVPAFIPGLSFIYIWLSSILFRVDSVKRVNIYSTFVPFFAEVSMKGIFLYLAKRRPSSKATFLLNYNKNYSACLSDLFPTRIKLRQVGPLDWASYSHFAIWLKLYRLEIS